MAESHCTTFVVCLATHHISVSLKDPTDSLKNPRGPAGCWAMNGLPASRSCMTLGIAGGPEVALRTLVISQLLLPSKVWLW